MIKLSIILTSILFISSLSVSQTIIDRADAQVFFEEHDELRNRIISERTQTYLIDSLTDSDWNEELGLWSAYAKTSYSYNVYGQQAQSISKLFDENLQLWENGGKYSYVYQENGGLLLESLIQSWDSYYENWRNSGSSEYTYSDENLLLNLTYFLWQEFDWEYDRDYTYTYNDDMLPATRTYRIWDEISNSWGNFRHHTFSYYDDERVKEEVIYIWSENENDWIPFERINYSYDTNERSMIFQKWNEDSGTWENDEEVITLYDGNPNKWILRTERKWEDGAWQNYRKLEYFWDDNDLLIETLVLHWQIDQEVWENSTRILSPNDENGNWIEDIMQHWDTQLGEWDNAYKISYYWSLHEVVAIKDESNPSFQIYPNPASEVIYISLDEFSGCDVEVQIFDARGKCCTKLNLNAILPDQRLQIDVSDKPTGLYFVKLKAAGQTTTNKIQLIR